jgi:hypothetical protein
MGANGARRLISLIGLLLLLSLTLTMLWLQQQRKEAERSLVVRVEPGTAARMAAGAAPPVFPQQINLRLSEQDTLVIRNDDSEPVTIGPYRIAPGQQFTQRYTSPGTFDLLCSIHATGKLRVVVTR